MFALLFRIWFPWLTAFVGTMTVLKALAALMALLVGAGTFAATRIVRATNLDTFNVVRIVTIFVFL